MGGGGGSHAPRAWKLVRNTSHGKRISNRLTSPFLSDWPIIQVIEPSGNYSWTNGRINITWGLKMGDSVAIDEEILVVGSCCFGRYYKSRFFVFNISTNPAQQLADITGDWVGVRSVAVNRKHGIVLVGDYYGRYPGDFTRKRLLNQCNPKIRLGVPKRNFIPRTRFGNSFLTKNYCNYFEPNYKLKMYIIQFGKSFRKSWSASGVSNYPVFNSPTVISRV